MAAPARRGWAAVVAALAIAATTVAARSAEPGAPRGVHVSFTANPRTSATVTWFTDGTASPSPAVEFGAGDALDRRAEATSRPVPGVAALAHEATLDDLPAGARVSYRVTGTSGSSPLRSFELAPSPDQPFRFTVFADHGTKPASATTVARVLDDAPALLLLAGDLSYANGVQPVWDEWFDLLEPIASRVPTMAAPGNHEYETFPFRYAAYRARLAQPANELWYGFDFGNVHFLMLDSDVYAHQLEGTLPAMIADAEADLAQAAARRALGLIDFIIIVQHHPLWGNVEGTSDRNQNNTLIALEEQWIHRYGIDVVIAAHNHHFERSKPMAYGHPTTDELHDYTDPAGYVYTITGGGGASLYGFRDRSQIMSWSAAYASRFHYLRFDVDGPRLTVDAVATDRGAPEIIDSWTLTSTR